MYYLYRITNLVNGKIYVGVHKSERADGNDGYMGSGKVIRSAIAKYGIENFTKVILELFETAEDAFAGERELVTEEFLSRPDVYNLRRGGSGGFDYINSSGLSGCANMLGKKQTAEHINARAISLVGKKRPDDVKRQISETRKVRMGEGKLNTCKGQSKTSEHKEKLREIALSRQRAVCIVCGKICTPQNLKRWHNEKCKHKGE